MDTDNDTIVKLRAGDSGEEPEYQISIAEGEISELIRNTTEDREDPEITIDIARVKSKCLKKVVDFMQHYNKEKMKEIPTPLGGSSFNEVCSQRVVVGLKLDATVGTPRLHTATAA